MPLINASIIQAGPEELANELVRRADVKAALTPNATQRTTLIVAGVYIIAIAILW